MQQEHVTFNVSGNWDGEWMVFNDLLTPMYWISVYLLVISDVTVTI